ncbi:hypothetical protein LEMLEM_LOCUS16270 [Lemmus lemmus]
MLSKIKKTSVLRVNLKKRHVKTKANAQPRTVQWKLPHGCLSIIVPSCLSSNIGETLWM